VLFLDEGRISGFGTYNELLESNEKFRLLLNGS